MTRADRAIRITTGLAMLSLIPAGLAIQLNYVAGDVSNALLAQEATLYTASEQMTQLVVSCTETPNTQAGALVGAVHFLRVALDATGDVNLSYSYVSRPEQQGLLDWTLASGLPFTRGTNEVSLASGSMQGFLAHLENNFDVCRRLSKYSDASDLRTEEERSRKWVSEQAAKLQVLYRNLADARRAFDTDRTGLAIIAWSLGALQVVGWGLLYFVILPQELRAWRRRRAERMSGP